MSDKAKQGLHALAQDRPDDAAAHWGDAVEAGLEAPQLLAFLGSRHFNAGRFERAAELLSRRLDAGGADRELMRYLVIALIRSGQHDRASDRLKAYFEHYPLDDGAKQLVRRWREARAEGGSEG